MNSSDSNLSLIINKINNKDKDEPFLEDSNDLILYRKNAARTELKGSEVNWAKPQVHVIGTC